MYGFDLDSDSLIGKILVSKTKVKGSSPFHFENFNVGYSMNDHVFFNDGQIVIRKADLLFKFLDLLKSNGGILCFMRINNLYFQKKIRCDLKKSNIKVVFFNGRLIGRMLNNLYGDMFLNSVFLIHVQTHEILFNLINSIEFKQFGACISILIEKYVMLLLNYEKLIMILLKKNQFFSFYFLFFRCFNFYLRLFVNLYYFIVE
jgi:hypothetical protein